MSTGIDLQESLFKISRAFCKTQEICFIMAEPVIIIGAGFSGLALAQGLLKHGQIPFRVFERDPDLHARQQGYRVRISEEGISALAQNLPPERFEKLKRCCAHVSPTTRLLTLAGD